MTETETQNPFKAPKNLSNSLPNQSEKDKSSQFNTFYTEPNTSGQVPVNTYQIQVIKKGILLETIKLENKGFFLIGRQNNSDIQLTHSSVSRTHSVLQFHPYNSSFSLLDCNSTHGTFINKKQIKSQIHVPFFVGQFIKIGQSTRNLFLVGPDNEREEELSMEDVKQNLEDIKLKKERDEKEREKKEKDKSSNDWGLSFDSENSEEEESENTFAYSHEALYIQDPKKALVSWFEKEGLSLTFETKEIGFAHFSSSLTLPLHNESIFVEFNSKNIKKKDCISQLSLKACRILDSKGLFNSENSARVQELKACKMRENDFLESDEDEFYDRTGDIERKKKIRRRQSRKGLEPCPITNNSFESLSLSLSLLTKEKQELESKIHLGKERLARAQEFNLDSYIHSLKDERGPCNKSELLTLQIQLKTLRKKELSLSKILEVSRPTSLPPLSSHKVESQKTHKRKNEEFSLFQNKKASPIFESLTLENKGFDEKYESCGKLRTQKEVSTTQREKSKELNSIPCQKYEIEKEKEKIFNGKTEKQNEEKTEKQNEEKTEKQNEEKTEKHEKEKTEKQNEDTKQICSSHTNLYTVKEGKSSVISNNRLKLEESGCQGNYVDSSVDPKYDIWTPPSGQTGDGRTALNDKYGY